MSELEDVLAHYGVKGMKWGKTTKSSSQTPGSADFERTKAVKTTAKKAGTKALSNEELRVAIERMNLEKQYKSLAPTPSQAVGKFVGGLLSNAGKQQASKVANDFAARKVAKAMGGK